MSNSPSRPETDENARLKRIIRAAEEAFKRFGFRAVTMELVAREASVAKATLYSHFENKDALYLAVCARMARLLRCAVERALAQPETPLDARLAQSVIAKHRMVFALVRGSAHAAELFSAKDAMAGDIFAALDEAILKALADAMAADAALAPSAARLARALYLGGAELASRSASAAEMENELAAFAAVHLAGARTLAGKESQI
ncbi:TetR/AcrR family transcriptional regulator [Methylocapsa sp. S129]|uniref:TetR/AcrR family transcriptional regulator n=1 Tax=Methylocapsa sp. S129 TaxID=1641869 RepID=UPI00131B73F5|nr:TetR/AcrR family transcriptional regulator [Methylocapsa sp. S129]